MKKTLLPLLSRFSSNTPTTRITLAALAFLALTSLCYTAISSWRLDLTSDRIYTLNQGSKNIAQKLEHPITFTLFFSNRAATGYPPIKAFADRVISLLKSYEQAAPKFVHVEVVDPIPFSEEEDRAMRFGLKGVDVDDQGGKIYLGLVVQYYNDETQVLPFIQFERERFLEYDLTRMIYDLSHPVKPSVGLLSTAPMMSSSPALPIPGMSGGSWAIVEQMQHVFNVSTIAKDTTSIPNTLNALMVVNPFELSEETLYAIDQYVVNGGKAIFFVDPFSLATNQGAAKDSKDGGIHRLFKKWGFDVATDSVVGDRELALSAAPKNSEDGSASQASFNNITWLGIRAQDVNSNDITTADLHTLKFITSGHIVPVDAVGTMIEPLVSSTPNAMEVPVSKLGAMVNTKALLEEFKESNEAPFTLAARISGTFASSFSAAPKSLKDAPYKKQADAPGYVVVVADSDLMHDQFWTQSQFLMGYRMMVPTSDNGGFVLNLLDHMSGSADLISLRGRGMAMRPFTKVEHLRQQAEQEFLVKEKLLEAKLKETEQKLRALQQDGKSQALLSVNQQEEIANFKRDMLGIRKQLRNVQAALRKDIETLGSIVKWTNILLAPIAVILFALWHFRRRAKRV